MKYCISGRHPLSLLKKVEEIKMEYRDREKILDYVEQIPEKTIILHIPKDTTDLNWNLYKMYSEKINFILEIEDLALVEECKENGIKFYWHYPITSFYELNGIIKLEPSYLFLGAPLCFSLSKVQKLTNIPIRLCANVSYSEYIPRENGICGHWIRPEGISAYERYVAVLEFEAEELQREQILYHVYHDNGEWPGNLNLLLKNFNFNVDNRALPKEIDEFRANCGQRCMENGTCHFCETAVRFAEAIRKKHEGQL